MMDEEEKIKIMAMLLGNSIATQELIEKKAKEFFGDYDEENLVRVVNEAGKKIEADKLKRDIKL